MAWGSGLDGFRARACAGSLQPAILTVALALKSRLAKGEEALVIAEQAQRTAAELGEWGPIYLERGVCVAELREMARARGLSH